MLVVIAVRWFRRDTEDPLAARYFERVTTQATDRRSAKAQAEARGTDAADEAHHAATGGPGT